MEGKTSITENNWHEKLKTEYANFSEEFKKKYEEARKKQDKLWKETNGSEKKRTSEEKRLEMIKIIKELLEETRKNEKKRKDEEKNKNTWQERLKTEYADFSEGFKKEYAEAAKAQDKLCEEAYLSAQQQQANFEGPWTLLMCGRLLNSEIRKQTVDLLCEEAKSSLTREEIEKEFDENLIKILTDTPISYGTVEPNANGCTDEATEYQYDEEREIINLNWIDPTTGKKPSIKILNIADSHEKGHVIRKYSRKIDSTNLTAIGSYCLGEKFYKAFDFGNIKISEWSCDNYREEMKRKHCFEEAKRTNKEILGEVLLKYLKRPSELAERMSQLKNYFGMNGNEKFTKEHLVYAREHYIKDTDFDNNMTQFFQAITPEKEDAFIGLINSAGI